MAHDIGGLPHRSMAWTDVELEEFLNADDRPTFVVELKSACPSVVFRNLAWRPEHDVDCYPVSQEDFARNEFRVWALADPTTTLPSHHTFANHTWHATTIRRRWRIISGSPLPTPISTLAPGRAEFLWKDSGAVAEWLPPKKGDSQEHDLTAAQPPYRSDDFVTFFRGFDWGTGPLGPMESWSPQLKIMVNIVLRDPHPAVLFWGPQMVSLYNEHYIPFVNVKHPRPMRTNYRDTWKELYSVPASQEFLDSIWSGGKFKGEALHLPQQTFSLLDGHRLSERTFNLTIYPIIGATGQTIGFYEPLREVTDQHVNERRSTTIRRIGELTALEEEPVGFFNKTAAALAENLLDVPFALVYAINNTGEEDTNKRDTESLKESYRNGSLVLRAHIGVKLGVDGTPLAHKALMDNTKFTAALDTLTQTEEPTLLDFEDQPELVDCFKEVPVKGAPRRGWGDDPRELVICPIEPIASRKSISALLILGVNTRRRYDDGYQLWMKTLSRYLSSSLASVLLLMEQKIIASEARKRTQDAIEMEQRALAMIETSSVGVFMMSPEGAMQYINQAWRDISDYHDPGMPDPERWAATVHELDKETMVNIWQRLLTDEEPVSAEVRLSKPWRSFDNRTGQAIEGITWVSAGTNIREIHGRKLITGSITDISRQKWDEAEQAKMKDEALERKRQQENFIDMTSHEMRNPLSAIFQCADAIASALQTYEKTHPAPDQLKLDATRARRPSSASQERPISFAIDLAKTITLCAQHQKRIVDDVLVLSKVDANLIEITPIEVQPHQLISNTLKMFSAELSSIGAVMSLDVEDSYSKQCAVDWVKLDPGRLLQVLINLCTNAIKFTAESERKQIKVALGACLTRPKHSSSHVTYMDTPAESKMVDPTSKTEWGDGEEIFLTIDVTDTGKGMTQEEMTSLFQRFKQASPRTHTQYGGSGLGLYIARLLSQLQGGEIGVTSEPGRGSTFAFFIKVRRSHAPGKEDGRVVRPESAIAAMLSEPMPESPLLGTGAKLTQAADVHVLIVEDNLVNQKVLQRQLNNIGFHTYVANNGQEAVDFLQKTRAWAGNPNGLPLTLVLMDVEMPVMSGTAATRHIRQSEVEGKFSQHIPIIAITGNARREQIQEVLTAGMDGVLPKPFRITELVHTIEGFTGPIKTGLDEEVTPP